MDNDPEAPSRLWKYREWDKTGRTRRLIVEGELYFPTVYELDDPFEFRWCDRFPVDVAERDRFVREFCARFSPNDTIDQRRLNYLSVLEWITSSALPKNDGLVPSDVVVKHGVFCASAINHDLLMWSLYAGRHRGICVSIFSNRFNDRRVLPVEYEYGLPVIDGWDYIRSDREVFVQSSLRKSPFWKYQDEWRTVGAPGVAHYPGIVDRIVIGAMVEKATREEVMQAVDESPHEIEVVQASLHPFEYKLLIPEFESGK